MAHRSTPNQEVRLSVAGTHAHMLCGLPRVRQDYPFAYSIGKNAKGLFFVCSQIKARMSSGTAARCYPFLFLSSSIFFFNRAGSLSNESSYCVLTELKLMRHLSPVLMTTIMLGNGAASPACPFTSYFKRPGRNRTSARCRIWFWNQRVSVRAGTNRTTRVPGLLASWEALRIQSPMFRP